ncbi:MAG: hypothetical protein JSS89_02495 [Bacteroidetes bacterium]|nr:hypothetical protein [Bacteroidota bacterium]
MKQRAVLVQTSDLNVLSTVGAHSNASSVHVQCAPTIDLLCAKVRDHAESDLCVIIDDEGADIRPLIELLTARSRSAVLIALVEHPYPDIVQQQRLQGITHVIKRDSLPDLLASITKEVP